MQARPDTQVKGSLVLSYLALRKSIGVIAIALPIVLAVGKLLLESPGLLDTLSAYYYSVMRDVWVGSLSATAVFLFSYRYARQDEIAGDLAGASALGVALLPAAPLVGATTQQMVIGVVHWTLSVIFLLTLAYFALVLFRKTDPNKPPTPQKLQRNRVYLVSGIVILAALALLGLISLLPAMAWLQALHPVFWLESLAIWAFGVAWFVKGETILKDK